MGPGLRSLKPVREDRFRSPDTDFGVVDLDPLHELPQQALPQRAIRVVQLRPHSGGEGFELPGRNLEAGHVQPALGRGDQPDALARSSLSRSGALASN